ncbi:MAG: hypothetical protein ABJB55_02105 [Actinomycetota bacterium]
MEVDRASSGAYDHGDADRFSGLVSLRSTLRADDGTNIGAVHFAPGARTHWHHHPGGQFLYGVTGRGRVRSRGEPATCCRPAT